MGRNKTGISKYVFFGPLDEWFKMGFAEHVRYIDHSGNDWDVLSFTNICYLPSAGGYRISDHYIRLDLINKSKKNEWLDKCCK